MAVILHIDGLSGERIAMRLRHGVPIGLELMRLYPWGIEGEWSLYAGGERDHCEMSIDEMVARVVRESDQFILRERPGTGTEAFFINLVFTVIFSLASKALTPRPTHFRQFATQERESGTNVVSGQTNVLRPGARVPDILGKLRVFPDLLTQMVEVWDRTLQTITQWFILGVGDYEITEYRLGDTLISNISSTAVEPFPPGREVEKITCVKYSSTVNSISLLAESVIPPVSGVSFQASTKTMTAPAAIALNVGEPITITGTLNAGDHFVLSLTGAQPPFIYHLNGTVVNESSTTPGIKTWMLNLSQGYSGVWVSGDDVTLTTYFTYAYAVGDAFHMIYAGTHYYGKLRDVVILSTDMSGQTVRLEMEDMVGVPLSLGSATGQSIFLENWHPPGTSSSGGALENMPTDWQVAPLQDFDQLWIDVAFPRGLAFYHNSQRQPYTVDVLAEFRRGTDDSVVIPIHIVKTDSTSQPVRWTYPVLAAELAALPAGPDPIQVRLTRVTPVSPDTSTDQYFGDTRWEAFRAVKILPERFYPDVYLVRVTLANSRSVAAADMAFNLVATRKLKTWSAGTGWSTDAAPTERWADNFVIRCQSNDGAGLTDAQIDLAGLYALQAQLDDVALDGGAQGKIGLALDQSQDIDTELAQIADVVRAQVYRVGQKLFATRDQSTPTRIALFNGRSKSTDAETVGVRFHSGDDHDAVAVTWMDADSGWKQREYQYPPIAQPRNVLRIGVSCANWPQAYRRAVYEWNRLNYRRHSISVSVTEDGRICRPGDVINITDDVANLAAAAGEVIYIAGSVLTLDHDVTFATNNTLLLRDTGGQFLDAIPVTAVAGATNQVQLTRAPIPSVKIKGRDEAKGTVYAFFNDEQQIVRQWIVSAVELNGPFIQLTGVNYSESVYAGDSGPLGTP